jgi:hypothetical protein
VLDALAGAELRVTELEALALDPDVGVGVVENETENELEVSDGDAVAGDVEDDAETELELSAGDDVAEDVAWLSVGAGDGNPTCSLITIPHHTIHALLTYSCTDSATTPPPSPAPQERKHRARNQQHPAATYSGKGKRYPWGRIHLSKVQACY